MSDNLRIPVLSQLVPEGVQYGKTLVVEFDPDSLWYAMAVNIVAECLRTQTSADYHAFSNAPDDIRASLTKLGVDVKRAEAEDQLWMIDFYSPGIGVKSKEKWTASSLKLIDIGIDRRPRVRLEKERRCLHLDDNWSIVFDHNDEKDLVQFFRSKIIPGTRTAQRVQLLGLTRGIHSEYVYKSLEDAAYGVVDVKTEEVEGKPESLLRVRSLREQAHDKNWHRVILDAGPRVRLE